MIDDVLEKETTIFGNSFDKYFFKVSEFFTLNYHFSGGMNNLCNIDYSRLVRYGRIGEDVRQTQQCLENLGYEMGPIDGIYGPKTYAGITAFQRSQNIKIDGIVGPQTVSYLNKL